MTISTLLQMFYAANVTATVLPTWKDGHSVGVDSATMNQPADVIIFKIPLADVVVGTSLINFINIHASL